MYKYIISAMLITSSAQALDVQLFKNGESWEARSYPSGAANLGVSPTGFSLNFTQSFTNSKCHTRDSEFITDFGIKSKATCSGSHMDVQLLQGYKQEVVNPNELQDGARFFVVIEENTSNTSQQGTSTTIKKATPVKDKQERTPAKF